MLKVSRRYYLEYIAVLLVVALLTTLVLRSGLMMPLSRYIYDNMHPLLPTADFSDVAIVSIDDASLEHIGSWPWNRNVHARIIENLTQYNTKAVVLDLIFSEPDTMRPESDAALMRALDQHGKVFLPVNLMADNFGGVLETMPHTFFAQTSAGMGHVNAQLDEDGVVRGIYMRVGIGQPSWRHISLAVHERLHPGRNELFRVRSESPSPILSLEQRHYRMIPFANVSNLVPKVSAFEVFEGTADPALLKDKVVFIGASATGLSDSLLIPVHSNSGRITGVELNANIYAALQDQKLIKRISTFWHWALSLTLAGVTIFALPLLAPRWAIPLVFLMLTITVTLSYALLAWYQLWLPTGAAIAGIIIAYPLWTWRRLEYSLSQLRRTLEWLSVHDDLNQRLIQSAPLSTALALLEKIMPVTAWRLVDKTNKRHLITSRNKVDSPLWNSPQARFYPFVYDNKTVELQLLWQHTNPTASQEQWVTAMLSRCEDSLENDEHSFDFLEAQIGRVRTQEQRQQALTHFFEVSLAQLREGVAIVDSTGQLLFLNRQASEWLGIPATTIHAYHLLDMDKELIYNHENGDWRAIIAEAITTGRSQLECQTSSGLDLYVDILRTRADRQPGEILLFTFKNVTEVKQATRTKSEMLDFLSHDLRSPMLSLLALAERYQGEHAEDAIIQEFSAYIRKYAHRSLNIAEQFLQLARAEATQSVDFTPVDMLAVVESAIEQSLIRAQQKQQRIHFDYALEDNVWVNGHYELLVRAVENLLSNAIKYSPENTQITVTLACHNKQVICTVEDQGQGIAPEFIDHLFERFSRAKADSHSGTHGAGLGLRFVQVVAQRHQGSINVESKVGKGSRFEICLTGIEM